MAKIRGGYALANAAVWFFLVLWAVVVSAQDFSGDAQVGKIKVDDERCVECHGLDGNIHLPNEASKIPKLAGQRPDYLLKQFLNFRDAEREHEFMQLMARTVDEADARDIIAWYAQLPVMQGKNTSDNPIGKVLFLAGDPQRKILPCISCHGPNGKGLSEPVAGFPDLQPEYIPIIGGQDWHYLEQQLLDWRAGTRSNSLNGVMNQATAGLTDKEIAALADYISGL